MQFPYSALFYENHYTFDILYCVSDMYMWYDSTSSSSCIGKY